jgi:hypothetical protein
VGGGEGDERIFFLEDRLDLLEVSFADSVGRLLLLL